TPRRRPGGSRPRIVPHRSVRGVVGGDHAVGNASAIADLVPALARPVPDVRVPLPAAARPGPAPATAGHPAAVLGEYGDLLADLAAVRRTQVNLVRVPVNCESDRFGSFDFIFVRQIPQYCPASP